MRLEHLYGKLKNIYAVLNQTVSYKPVHAITD